MKNSTADELRSYWQQQLGEDEQDALKNLGMSPPSQKETPDIRAIVAWADEHLFARKAVVNDYELKSAALARGRGEDFEVADLDQAIAARGYCRGVNGTALTTRELSRCHQEIIRAAQLGGATRFAIRRDYAPDGDLSPEQARAARQILGSTDLLTLFRGRAGTGKSRTLQEIERVATSSGHSVVVLAPQRQQVQSLEDDGLRAQTLAHILTTREIPPRAIVILDEAGQVGVREMHDLISLVKQQLGRLILSGDTRQHGPVAAGDALLAIEEYVPRRRIAELRTIRRQNPALARSAEEKRLIREYRETVKEASELKTAQSFDRLNALGWVRELPDEPRRAAIAGEYLLALQRDEKPLVVSQTWNEVHAANDAIRLALQSVGKLEHGQLLTAYQPVDRTEAQKRDQRFYEPGQAAFFLKRYGRHRKGEVSEIAGASERGVSIVRDGRLSTVGYRYADRFAVVQRRQIEVSPGDRLQLKANGRSIEGHRLHNGELVTVASVERSGALVVTDERGATKTLAPSQRLFVRGYAVTSYASQGKTVDTVIVADAGSTSTNARHWYVGISRGRKRVVVLTPDKAELRETIRRSGERELALRQESAGNAGQGMRVPGRTQRIRKHIELARRHYFVTQQINRAQNAGQRV